MELIKIQFELAKVAKDNGLDIEANMPDFVIARFMLDSFSALMVANKANDEWFKLSAQEDEIG